MDELSIVTANALQKYFDTLAKTGYTTDKEMVSILVLAFISDFIRIFNGELTDEDQKVLDKVLNCLASTTCSIDYVNLIPTGSIFDSIFDYTSIAQYRITEDDNIRATEKGNTRIADN